MRIVDGWLQAEEGDPPVIQVRSPKSSALATPGPLGVVWHWTGWLGMDPVAYCRAAAASSREASWHVMVTRDGRMIQGIPFTRGSWHVGRRGRVAGQERSVNGCTVGVELENAGRLKQVEGRWRYFVGGATPWQGVIPGSEAVLVPGMGTFHDFPEAQREAAAALVAALVDEFDLEVDACSFGHIDFAAPGSREDPGPLWGCQKWPTGPALLDVLERALGAPAGPVGLPTFCDDPGVAGNDCGGGP
jgi:N-acetyl-anhydromuramyl-L-alanine amidase AmpD